MSKNKDWLFNTMIFHHVMMADLNCKAELLAISHWGRRGHHTTGVCVTRQQQAHTDCKHHGSEKTGRS